MSEALENKIVFELHQVNGTWWDLVPEKCSVVNNPGYHFHFLSLDKRIGGHVEF